MGEFLAVVLLVLALLIYWRAVLVALLACLIALVVVGFQSVGGLGDAASDAGSAAQVSAQR